MIIQSWIDSLKLFAPKNFSLFLLVSLNTLIRSFKHVLQSTAFIFLASYLIVRIAIILIWGGSFPFQFVFGFLVPVFISWVMAVRPSVAQKTVLYYQSYWFSHGLYLLGALFPIMFYLAKATSIPFLNVVIASAMPPLCFGVFFYFDTSGGVSPFIISFWRGLKLFVYNLPASLILMTPIMSLIGLIYFLLPGYLGLFIGYLISLISVCLFMTIYVKKVHEQFTFYFKTKQKTVI